MAKNIVKYVFVCIGITVVLFVMYKFLPQYLSQFQNVEDINLTQIVEDNKKANEVAFEYFRGVQEYFANNVECTYYESSTKTMKATYKCYSQNSINSDKLWIHVICDFDENEVTSCSVDHDNSYKSTTTTTKEIIYN